MNLNWMIRRLKFDPCFWLCVIYKRITSYEKDIKQKGAVVRYYHMQKKKTKKNTQLSTNAILM